MYTTLVAKVLMVKIHVCYVNQFGGNIDGSSDYHSNGSIRLKRVSASFKGDRDCGSSYDKVAGSGGDSGTDNNGSNCGCGTTGNCGADNINNGSGSLWKSR